MKRVPLPSRRLLVLAGGVLALGSLVPIVPMLVFFWRIAVGLVILLVIEDFLLRPKPGCIRVQREVARISHVGRQGSYLLRVSNHGNRTLAAYVHDRLPAELEGSGHHERILLGPGEHTERKVEFVGLARGEHALLPVGLRVSHRLGLLEYQERADAGKKVRVAPGRPAGETAWLIARATVLEQAGEQKVRRRGTEWEFESLREYVVGDELRRIDWKASARRHQPMVRQYRSERNAEVVLGLDCGRLMGSLIDGIRKLDLAVTPLLDLAAVALRRGERVGLLAFDSEPRVYLPPRAGVAQLNAMLDALASLGTGDLPTSYLRAVAHLEARHRKRSMVLMFTDFTDDISAQEAYASLRALARKHILMFIAVTDPHLEDIFEDERDDESSLFEQAVAGQLLAERRRVLARIERLGVATLDAEPRSLSGPLIRKFLQVRLAHVL